jgi:hypothetical protein
MGFWAFLRVSMALLRRRYFPLRSTDKISSNERRIVVHYGEEQSHLYSDHEHSNRFFATEAEADKGAKEHSAYDRMTLVAILRGTIGESRAGRVRDHRGIIIATGKR